MALKADLSSFLERYEQKSRGSNVSSGHFRSRFWNRMQELTVNTPKPLLSLNGSALIEHAIGHARNSKALDFRKRTFSVGKLENYFNWFGCLCFR